MKVGILFPLSNVYPGMGLDFMDGFNSFLEYKEQANQVSILKEGIGFGGDEKDVYKKAEKLLISDDVDILIAYIDEKVLPILYPLAQATGKLLLVVNPGANYPLNWIAQPTVIRLNLQHAFLCALTGRLTATNGNGQAALATSYYDCGYLHSAAMVNNFLEAGGEIKYNYVNNQAYDESFEINNLLNYLTTDRQCNNLLCVFDKLPATLFFKCLDKYRLNDQLQLFISPMMLHQALDERVERFSYSMYGYLSWYKDLKNENNQQFQKSCTRKINIFSLLGWETGMILNEVSQHNQNDIANGELLVGHLKNTTTAGPRGNMKLDDETQFFITPVTKFSFRREQANPEIINNIDIENEWRHFISTAPEGPVTGWTNTYLCY